MKLRRIVLSIVAAAVMTAAPFSTAYSAEEPKKEEPKVTGSASVGFMNKYVFRGYELSKDSLIIQPSLSASYYGFTAALWGNLDTSQTRTQSFNPDTPDRMSWNETDLTLSYTYVLDKWSFTGGYIYYGTEYMEQTQELFLSVAYDIITKPVLTIYRDIDSYSGTYFNLALSHSFPVYKETTLDLGASFGYFAGSGGYWKTYQSATAGYTGSKYSALHDGMVKLGFTIPFAKNATMQPFVQYWFPLSGDAKEKIDGVSYNPNGYLKDLWVFGLNVALAF